MHVDVALADDFVVFEVVNMGGTHHAQATLDQALRMHKQAADSHTRRWGGHGLGLRHTAAMLKLLKCPPLSLTAKADAVTARFSIPYRPCPPSRCPSMLRSPFDELAATAAATLVGDDDGADGTAHPMPAPKEKPLRLRSVLAVDDEEFIRTLTQLALEDHCDGCEVVTAENGARAAPSLDHGTPRLHVRLHLRLHLCLRLCMHVRVRLHLRLRLSTL